MRAKVRSRQKAQEDLKAPQVPPKSGSMGFPLKGKGDVKFPDGCFFWRLWVVGNS